MNKEKILQYILIIISIILAVILIVLLVTKEDGKEKKDSEDKKEVKEEIKYERHVSYNNLFAIEAPSTYKEVEKYSLNKKGLIELNDEDKSSYVLVVMTSKKDLNENFSAYKKRVFQQKEAHYGTKITNYVKTVIDNHDAEYGEIYYTSPTKVNIYIRTYAVETNNYFGQVVIWTLASNEDEVQDEFNKIASSFKEIPLNK